MQAGGLKLCLRVAVAPVAVTDGVYIEVDQGRVSKGVKI